MSDESSILVDVKSIITPNNLWLLKSYITPIPKTKKMVGVIFVLPKQQLIILKNKSTRKDRIQYMNEPEFIRSIIDFSYLIFDKKTCSISHSNPAFTKHLLENTLRYLPNDMTLECRIPARSYSPVYKKYGFNVHSQTDDYVVVRRLNDIPYKKIDYDLTLESNYDDDNRNRTGCAFKARLSDTAVNYFKDFARRGSTFNRNGSLSQKEIAGSLIVTKIDRNLGNYLDVDFESLVKNGAAENVTTEPTQITFHSHPFEAYKHHKVQIGIPSSTDYASFLKVRDEFNLILHIVFALEGFYIVSCSEELIKSKQKITTAMVQFVKKEMTTKNDLDQSIKHHLDKINNMRFNGQTRLIDVQFIPWFMSNEVFQVVYAKKDGQCAIPRI